MTPQQSIACGRCERVFVSDNTPMAKDGYCMLCRPHVQVSCLRCGVSCAGAYDGKKRCRSCRASPQGAQQYEDLDQALREAGRAWPSLTQAEWDELWQRFYNGALARRLPPNKAITEANGRMEQHRHGPRPEEIDNDAS